MTEDYKKQEKKAEKRALDAQASYRAAFTAHHAIHSVWDRTPKGKGEDEDIRAKITSSL